MANSFFIKGKSYKNSSSNLLQNSRSYFVNGQFHKKGAYAEIFLPPKHEATKVHAGHSLC